MSLRLGPYNKIYHLLLTFRDKDHVIITLPVVPASLRALKMTVFCSDRNNSLIPLCMAKE